MGHETRAITSRDQIIDSRDLIERTEYLESLHSDDEGDPVPREQWDDQEEAAEHDALTQIRAAMGEFDRHDCVVLIRKDYFTEYVMGEYGDTGNEYYEWNHREHKHELIPWNVLMDRMPFSCIDWDAVAESHKRDYDEIEWDGSTFYYQLP